MQITALGTDPRTVTVSSATVTQIAGPNPRRRRLTISPPLSNPVNVGLDGNVSATTGYPLVVGGGPLILDSNLFGGDITQAVVAIAIGGTATVYVIDEFELPEFWP